MSFVDYSGNFNGEIVALETVYASSFDIHGDSSFAPYLPPME